MLICKDFCHSVNMHGTYTNRYRFPQVFLSLRSRTDHRRGCGMHPEARRRSDFSSLRRRTLMTNDWQRAFHQSTRVCDSIYVCFHHMSMWKWSNLCSTSVAYACLLVLHGPYICVYYAWSVRSICNIYIWSCQYRVHKAFVAIFVVNCCSWEIK
jgi:hypothetical protein